VVYYRPMNAHHTDALDRAIGRIVDAMRPEAIYLFGSHARGDAGADSDYDLLVIVPDDTPNGMRLLEETARVPPETPAYRSTLFPAAEALSNAGVMILGP
jgi:predicted nucleotidyltransferase